MASHRRFGESRLISQGLILVVLAALTTGCRSAGGVSRMPGMGWLAGSQRSGERGTTEIDPTASLPAPSSVTTPQTLADAERTTAPPTHQPVSYDAPQQERSSVAPANYPSTGYATIPGITRPEPNPSATTTTGTTPRASSPGSDYVQQGPYAPNVGAAPADAATTWNSSPQNPDSIAANSPSNSSIYPSPTAPQVAETASVNSNSNSVESVYGATVAPVPSAPNTTWNGDSVTTVYPPYDMQASAPSPSEPLRGSEGYPMQEPVAPASYSSAGGTGGSLYQDPVEPAAHTATATSESWRPGSTSSYPMR